MAIFPSMAITNDGQLLYNKAQAGATLNFTGMKLGAGRLADGQDPQTVSALIDYKFDVTISSITQNTELKVAVITGSRNNSDVDEGTYICELGLYALDPDVGEILYAYSNAGGMGDYFAPASRGAFTWSYQINAAVGNAANVTATLSSNAFDHAIAISEASFAAIAGTTQKEVNQSIDNLLSTLQYQIADVVSPFAITLSANPSVAETGSTQNSIVLSWTYPRDPVSQVFEGSSVLPTLRTETYTTPTTAAKTFTLVATIEGGIIKTKTVTVPFYNGIYYGKSSSLTFDADLISSLTKVLSDTRARTISVTAGVGEFIYYCIPTRLGVPSFTVGGFTGGFTNVATLSFTNPSGYTENYDVYKSDNANLGATSIVIS